MTREEKEKAYDEALKVIKGNLDALNEITETGAETVNIQSIKNCFYKAFPELKESEDSEDEKARKWIYDYISNCPNESFEFYGGIGKKAVLAWLEKQKNTISSYEEKLDRCVCENFNKGVREVLLHPEEYGLVKQSEQEEPQVYETGDGEIITYSETDGYKVWDEKQQEQKPEEWDEEDKALFELLHQCVCRCINDDRIIYSERERISKTMIPFIDKLQALHPQSKAEWRLRLRKTDR